MPSSPQIEIDSLLEPIPGDEAAGNAVPFNIRKQLDEHRKEIIPVAAPEDYKGQPEEPKAADWASVIEVAQETLKETSKDMLVAARLTEALAKEHGFGGLRDGLMLMRRLVEDCWDRLHPSIEDGDVEVRAAAFNWLDDADRGARFPHSVRGIGFLPGDERKYSWRDWRDVMDGRGEVTKEKIEAATDALEPDDIQNVVDDITEAMAEVDKIVEITTEKMGEFAPGLSEVRTALRECLALAEPIREKKAPAPAEEESVDADLSLDLDAAAEGGNGVYASDDSSAEVSDGGGGRGRRMNTRAEVYAQLEQVSKKLLDIDPHSPISYLVMRAVKLSKLTLPQLLKALIRNEQALDDLSRDLDLGVEESSDSGENIAEVSPEEEES